MKTEAAEPGEVLIKVIPGEEYIFDEELESGRYEKVTV